jgi:hypothetical protein
MHYRFASRLMVLSEEHYFVAQPLHLDVDVTDQEEDERQVIVSYRWWAIRELYSSGEVVVPSGIVELIARIIAGDIPNPPVKID